MTTLTFEVPADVYQRLHKLASQQGKPVEVLAREWLVERSTQAQSDLPPPAPADERAQAIAALHAAGLLTDLSAEEKARAARSTLTLAEARAMLDRVGGTPLSEVILEMRGPKE